MTAATAKSPDQRATQAEIVAGGTVAALLCLLVPGRR